MMHDTTVRIGRTIIIESIFESKFNVYSFNLFVNFVYFIRDFISKI